MKHVNTKIVLIIAVLTVGFFAVAMAHDGNGTEYSGHMMGPGMMGYGMGYHGHMMDNGSNAYSSNLSKEEAAELQKAQEKFRDDTQDLRNTIEEKQLALNQEIRKETPDRDKAVTLQKELSKLESQFDEKVLEHRLELKKTFPDTVVGMMAYGNGEGYCW